MIYDPSEFIKFINRIKHICHNKNNVYIDMSNVKYMTPDAITTFIAIIKDRDILSGMRVRGNTPPDQIFTDMLLEAGFFEHVKPQSPVSRESQAGKIFEKQSYQVESKRSRQLLERADKLIGGDWNFHWDGIQATIVECMNNTVNHASGVKEGDTKWWLSVYCDKPQGIAHFTFVDNGIGIFESLEKKGLLQKIKKYFGFKKRARVLKNLLDGKVSSSTGLKYRGRGLPNINRIQERGALNSLKIVSNNVFADVAQGKFEAIGESFSGTFLYWRHSTPTDYEEDKDEN